METEELIQSEIYHSFISEMSMYMYQTVDIYPKVHVSKTIQATCTCMQMYIYSIMHVSEVKSSFLLFFPDFDPLGSSLGSMCVSGAGLYNTISQLTQNLSTSCWKLNETISHQ